MKKHPQHKGQKRQKDRSHSISKSTTCEAQRLRIIGALQTGPKTSYDLRRLGCYQVPARIIELRRAGHDIRTELVELYDREGYRHMRCARYHLIQEAQ